MADAELYLFTGPELGEKNDRIDSLKQAFRKKYGSVDEYSYYAGDVRFADVIAQLQNQGLFTQATFIVLKNAETLKNKDDLSLLASWVASGSENTLILTTDENTAEKKLTDLVPAKHREQFWEMFENRKQQWLTDYFRKNGLSITGEAVNDILDMVENNTQSLKNECIKFFYCFEKGHKVTEEDVEKILAHTREESAFTLFDAMCDTSLRVEERFENSINILQKIKIANKKSSSSSYSSAVISGLLWSFRKLRLYHQINPGGNTLSANDLKNKGFASMQAKKFSKAASLWGPGVTTSIIALIAKTEMDCRESSANEDTLLAMMLYSIIIKNGVFCASADYSI